MIGYLLAGLGVILATMWFTGEKPVPKPVPLDPNMKVTMEQAAKLAKDAGLPDTELINAVAICMAESSCDPKAHNNNPDTGDDSYGLWQINMIGRIGPERKKRLGLDSYDDLFKPEINAKAMVQIYREAGWRAWGAYSNGSYKKYLGQARVAVDNILGYSK
jgi:hypothetical protein